MATREVRYRLIAETDQAKKAMKEMGAQVEKLGSSFADKLGPAGKVLSAIGPAGLAAAAGVGALVVAAAATAKALADATREAVAYGGTFQDLADSTNIGAEALQRLAAAGKPSGTSINEIASAVKKLEQNISKTPEKFAQLGLSVEKLKAMKPDQAFAAVTAQINLLGSQSEKTAASMALFGKGFDLKLLATDMKAVADRAEALGQVMSAGMIGALDDVGDEAGVLSDTWQHLWLNIGAGIASTPGLKEALSSVTEALGEMSQWVIQNQDTLHDWTQMSIIPALEALRDLVKLLHEGAKALKEFSSDRMIAMEQGGRQQLPRPIDQPAVGPPQPAGTGLAALLGGYGLQAPTVLGTSMTPKVVASATKPKLGSVPTWTNDDANKAIAEHKKYLAEVSKGMAANFEALAKQRAGRESANDILGADEQDVRIEIGRIAQAIEDAGGVSALTASQLANVSAQLNKLKADSPEAFRDAAATFGDVVNDASVDILKNNGNMFAKVADGLKPTGIQISKIKGETIDWSRALEDVANTLQVLGPGFAGIAQVIGGISSAMAALKNINLKNAQGGFSITGGKGFGGLLGNIAGGLQFAGAAIGIGKAIVGLFKSDPIKKAQKEAGKTLGVGISRELAEAISKQAKSLGISVGNASLLNISKAMAESGKDARSFSGQITSLMQAIKSGAVPAAEGMKELGESFNSVADAALKAGSVGDRALVSLLKNAREMGIESPEMKAFVGEQLGRAAGGVAAMQGISINTEADAKAQATIFSAAFWATVKEQGILRAGDAFKASFATLSESLSAGGFDVSGILGPIADIIGLSDNEVFRGAIEGAEGLREALEGVANAGYLTTDSFAAFQQQAGAAYEQAIAGGASSAQALQSIAPLLQSLQSASQNYGINLDASTQALIDQAKAAGVAFKTEPVERMAQGIDRLVIAMEKLAGISHDVADGFGSMAGSIGGPSMPGGEPGFAGGIRDYAEGGYVPPRPGGTIIRVGEGGEGEFVTPVSKAGGINAGGAITIHAPVTFSIAVDATGQDLNYAGQTLGRAIRDNAGAVRDAIEAVAKNVVNRAA